MQKHYKKQAFICLDISVLAAFSVAQENTVLFQNLGRLDLNRNTIGQCGLVFASDLLLWHLCNTGQHQNSYVYGCIWSDAELVSL